MEADLRYIFCVDCANNSFSSALVCPACETSLTENDDIVFTDLNPSEDYKSSVLSGLRPDLVVEICSRALSFWTYQTTQEACFQEMLYKNLEEKYTQLEKQVQGVMRDAQSEITSLRAKLQALQKDMELEKRKTHDLAEQLQEKSRQFSKLQIMYDKLKRRTLVPAMQQTVQNNTTSNAGACNPISGGMSARQDGVSNQSGMARLYNENIMTNNRAPANQQQWNTTNNQENDYYAPYTLHRAQPSSTQDYHSVREQTLAIGMNNNYNTRLGGVGRRMMDGNEMNAFQSKGINKQINSVISNIYDKFLIIQSLLHVKGPFTQTRTPFAMASNQGVRTRGIG
ncbi:unnamed protein product [Rhizophagus irregularis]|nr:unnamed protein product [Rhizophagus irregularis]